jgi:hypothetical protein
VNKEEPTQGKIRRKKRKKKRERDIEAHVH